MERFPREHMGYFVIIGTNTDIEKIYSELSECTYARRVIIVDNREERHYTSVHPTLIKILNMQLIRRFEMMIPSGPSSGKSGLVTFLEENKGEYPIDWTMDVRPNGANDHTIIDISRPWQWMELSPFAEPPKPNERGQSPDEKKMD